MVAFASTVALAPFSIASAAPHRGVDQFAENRIPEQTFTASEHEAPVESLEGIPATPAPQTASFDAADLGADQGDDSEALYTLQQFMFHGVVNWGGYKFTFYSQQVLPGGGLQIPGRHVSDGGYVTDADGFIVLAGSAPKGTVYATPFGAPGKIYDRGTHGNHLDVYIR